MKTFSKLLLVGVVAFSVGSFTNNIAFSAKETNIAVVNVQKVVSSYSKVNDLKTKQEAKIADLKKFVEAAKADVEKEKDPEKQKALEFKYNQQLRDKKSDMDKSYTKDLEAINDDVTKVINKTAKENNYDVVLTNTSVLYGGKDITKDIVKALK